MKSMNFLRLCAVWLLVGLAVPTFAQKYSSGGTDSGSSNSAKKTNTSPSNNGNGAALTAIGALSAQAMFNTYLVIGSISDNFVSETYDAETANSLLEAQVGMIEKLEENLAALENGFLTDQADIDFMRDVVRVMGGLKKQAQLALKYVASGDANDATKFDNQRQANWGQISKLLDIE